MPVVVSAGAGMPANFSTVVGEVWAQITNCMNTVVGSPILLIGVGVSFAGAVIGLTKRFIRFGGGRRRA